MNIGETKTYKGHTILRTLGAYPNQKYLVIHGTFDGPVDTVGRKHQWCGTQADCREAISRWVEFEELKALGV